VDHISDLLFDRLFLAAELEGRHHNGVLVVRQDVVDLSALPVEELHVLTKEFHDRLLAFVVTGKGPLPKTCHTTSSASKVITAWTSPELKAA